MKRVQATVLVLFALVALFAVACGDSEDETVVDPTPAPAVAPTPVPPTPTPEPPAEPTPAPAAPADAMPDTPAEPAAMKFDVPKLGLDATGQDIVDNLLTEEEAMCVRTNVGDEAYEALLKSPVLDPTADVTGGEVLGPCLSKESSVVFFLTGMNAAIGGMLGDETLNCIGNGLLPLDADILAAETDPSVMFAFFPCLSSEEMAALTAVAPAPPQ